MKLLAPFGKLYGRVMDLRNRLYDRGVLKSYDLGVRTISVGNLTTGGTGKTPLAALIAQTLIDEGETVCILTRGYGRKNARNRVLVCDGEKILADAAAGGDEPVELAFKLDGKAIIVADPDRVAAAKWARERFLVTTFILDDGFQHRRARRDLDIVCIDATNPCGNGRILPAGTLRESLEGLKRADAIVITRADRVSGTKDIEERIRKRNAEAPVFRASTALQGLVPLEAFHAKKLRPQSIADRVFAFTAIGNPGSFFGSLEDSDLAVVGTKSFRDHYPFIQRDIHAIESEASAKSATALVTTAKDAVKLTEIRFEIPCHVAIAETVIEDLDDFRKLIRGDHQNPSAVPEIAD